MSLDDDHFARTHSCDFDDTKPADMRAATTTDNHLAPRSVLCRAPVLVANVDVNFRVVPKE